HRRIAHHRHRAARRHGSGPGVGAARVQPGHLMTSPHGVLVVDDHTLVRTGVVNIISHESDLHVVAEAANGVEAVDAYAKHHPDVTLLDLRMPVMEGVEAVRQIRALDPDAQVIVLTTYD